MQLTDILCLFCPRQFTTFIFLILDVKDGILALLSLVDSIIFYFSTKNNSSEAYTNSIILLLQPTLFIWILGLKGHLDI